MKNRSIDQSSLRHRLHFPSKRWHDRITINGHRQVMQILESLKPFLKFKEKQAECDINSAQLLLEVDFDKTIMKEKLVDNILIVQSENYATRQKRSKEELRSILGLTP